MLLCLQSEYIVKMSQLTAKKQRRKLCQKEIWLKLACSLFLPSYLIIFIFHSFKMLLLSNALSIHSPKLLHDTSFSYFLPAVIPFYLLFNNFHNFEILTQFKTFNHLRRSFLWFFQRFLLIYINLMADYTPYNWFMRITKQLCPHLQKLSHHYHIIIDKLSFFFSSYIEPHHIYPHFRFRIILSWQFIPL